MLFRNRGLPFALATVLLCSCLLQHSAGRAIEPSGESACKAYLTTYLESHCDQQTEGLVMGLASKYCREEGYLIGAISMGLNHLEKKIDGAEVSLIRLNQWLLENQGYLDQDEIDLKSLQQLQLRYLGRTQDRGLIQQAVERRSMVLVQPSGSKRWALAYGVCPDGLLVLDSGLENEFFAWTDVEACEVFEDSDTNQSEPEKSQEQDL